MCFLGLPESLDGYVDLLLEMEICANQLQRNAAYLKIDRVDLDVICK